VKTHSFLFFQPYALLILQQQRMPGLFHIQVTAPHFELVFELDGLKGGGWSESGPKEEGVSHRFVQRLLQWYCNSQKIVP
jgi:hypothetical protein